MMIDARRLRAAAAAMLSAALIFAAPAARAELDDRDRADIARVEAYLNRLATLEARFVQLDSAGEAATGKLQVRRPGRLRIDYDPPTPVLLVSPGRELIHYDRDLRTATRLDWAETPAWFLLADKVSLVQDSPYRIVEVQRAPESLVVTAVSAEAPEDGHVAVAFSDRLGSLGLAGWVAVDALGQPTRITLFDVSLNMPIDDSAFVFDEPLSAFERQEP